MSPWLGALIGGSVGLVFATAIVYFAVHPPATNRQNMGYKRWSGYGPEARTRLKRAGVIWLVGFAAAAAGLGAWAFPHFHQPDSVVVNSYGHAADVCGLARQLLDALGWSCGIAVWDLHDTQRVSGGGKQAAQVHRDLAEFADAARLARISRSIRRSDKIQGYVLDIGEEWVLLAALDPSIYLDGFIALRIGDITSVKRPVNEQFVRRALETRDQSPTRPAAVDLHSTAALIRSAGEWAPLVTIHTEADDPDVCYIGRPMKVTKRKVHLLKIDPTAEWDQLPTTWPLSAITRVDFGGRYEAALATVGGLAPSSR